MRSLTLARAVLGCAILAVAACSEQGEPLAPAPENPGRPAGPTFELSCNADVQARTVTCGAPSTGASKSLTVGGQGSYVQLTSTNINITGGIFSFDVTVQNLIPQALGTTDGTTLDPNGVKVFFHSGPTVTGGTGTASVNNPDGTGDFTGTAQPYYQYDEVLSPNETSGSKHWELALDPGVTSVAFKVYVTAEVQFPQGWVDVTPNADTLVAGSTVPLSWVVRDVLGRAMSDQSVTFQSSDPAVASVDGTGVVTGADAGVVSVTATNGPRTGTARIAICPNLAVGQVYTASMPKAANLCFAGGTSGAAEYTYMPLNFSTSSALSMTITGTGIQAVTGPPSPNLIPGGASLAPLAQVSPDNHLRSRARMAAETAPLMMNRAARIQGARTAGAARRAITPGVPSLGGTYDLNVAQGCSGPVDNRRGVVRSIGRRIIIVSDTANPAGGFTTAQYDSIAAEFDSIAFPVDSANFGMPSDVDSNGRIIVFFTRAVNELSPPASSALNPGYFTNRDVFSSDPVSGCERSNAGEILYSMVPDPTGAVNSNVRTVSFVRGSVIRVLGHELQHLINATRRVYITGAANFEETWLDEGLSTIAEEMMFYRTSFGLAPGGNIQLSSLTTGTFASRRVAAFNTYANNNFGNLRSWLQRPDTTGAFRMDNPSSLAFRGVSWAFLRYAADRSAVGDATFWSSLVNSNLEGKANIQNAIGGASPDLWLRDFVAAMYADDAVAGVSATYTQPSWNFRSVFGGLGGVPIGTRPLTNGVGLTLSYSRGGSAAYVRFGVPASGFAGVTALSGGTIPTSPYGLIVIRTK
jgi:hypothetical protein